MIERYSDIAIHKVLNLFEKGNMALLDLIADDIDLRIEHYKDDAQTSWQQCNDKAGFITLLTRLSTDIFPKGTLITSMGSQALGDGWHITTFDQSFWYGEAKKDVSSRTYIISHELAGKVDYFRETVSTIRY
ncbi:hypothetical protein AMS58_02370 [Pseudoalteromonas porphyrae]|uniref:SnoaL-like domain-containing protein n=2 Tax=Pseudoalteromonas TaxID=53246 RepID=A0A0N0M0T4_9GAMM|nr:MULTISPECIES: hypothetical protein [Pseudoalteromonas]KPH63829.1 hypothetical protein ADS77_07915 [Pseudoalteromonas porphyrae]KPH96423.1 hypothetical protein AMS58_02370 [Pseudoalteromonas porphyrae]NMR25740.1 hypothetical protein [Pseudoalteromonas sp. NEC-BIFX-2020_015]NNG41815.1 hypothetical protein [Pseudoalteromonas sp. NEC-BIFX-2020_002]